MRVWEYGRSVEGRPLVARRFGPDEGPTALVVFGAIHGDEPASATLCARLAAALAGRALAEAVIVIEAANPDGLAAGRKNNARDVDLNRNFPARNFTPDHAPGYDPGPAPLSEPESAALLALLDDADPRHVVAVHQPFACVNWDGPAEALARAMATASGLPAQASVGYPTPGSFGSLWGVDRGRPVITLELARSPDDAALERAAAALECARLFDAR